MRLTFALLLAFFVFSGCGTPSAKQELSVDEEEGAHSTPLSSRAPPPTGPLESVPTDESDNIRKILSLIEGSYAKRERQKPILRVAYAKGSGCAPGSFTISKNIPLYLRWGIFSKPGSSFPIWARFSGANGGYALPDTSRDSRGMAIKLLGIRGQKLLEDSEKSTHDILFQNSPSFPAKDVADVLHRMTAAQLYSPHEVGSAFRQSQEPVGNPLFTQYFSVIPTKLGDAAVKYRVTPTDCRTGRALGEREPNSEGKDYLRDAMKSSISRGRACFSVDAQPWKDPVTTPIEDASVTWTSRFERVAWIVLEKESAAAFARNSEACEKMSFSPWHGSIEHQPLGGLARLSREAYTLSTRIRHKMNSWPDQEPPGP